MISSSVTCFPREKKKDFKPKSLFPEPRSILIVLKIWVYGSKYHEAVYLTTESQKRTGKVSPDNLTFWPRE